MSEVEPYKATHFVPYASTAEAFLAFIGDFKKFQADNPDNPKKAFLQNGRKDKTSMLLPRETLGLAIMASVANYLSGDNWVPGYMAGEAGKLLPERQAHDGAIRCLTGPRKGAFMRFEQVMATQIAKDATPLDIEGAVIQAVNKKSAEGKEYAEGLALIVFVDYDGKLNDLRQLARDVAHSKFEVIYLICSTSPSLKDFVCVILKSPGDTPGTIGVEFNRSDGVADVERLRDEGRA